MPTKISLYNGIGLFSGLVGVTNGSNAAAGQLGEFFQTLIPLGSAVSLTAGGSFNIGNLSLTAGDWDVDGAVVFAGNAATTTRVQAGLTVTSAVMPTNGTQVYQALTEITTSFTTSISIPRQRFSLTTTTNVYIIGMANFTAGLMTGYGQISARRIR